MKFVITATVVLAALWTMTLGEAKAGVSISVGEPGFYGRIDIGNYPPPRLIYSEPIIVRRVTTWYPPIYLRVPPLHAQRWYQYCDRYDACGRPVYFVHDDWYRDVYIPHYHKHRRDHGHYYSSPGHKPDYYEYRKYRHRPSKKVYIREHHDDDDRSGRDSHGGRGRH